MKRLFACFLCALLLTGCVSPAAVPEQTHPLATALPATPAAEATPSQAPQRATPVAAATPSQAPAQTPSDPSAALAARYLETLTGCSLAGLPYTAEFREGSGDEPGEWDVSFALPDQPVTANVRFTEAGALTFYALWTHGQTDGTLKLPLAPMPDALAGADYKEIMAYWYGLLPIREDAPFKRTELVRTNDGRQYSDSAYVLSVTKMRFEDGSVLTSHYDQGTKRLVYFCHYTAESLGR